MLFPPTYLNFNTDPSLWRDAPGVGTHAAYPVLLVVDGDVHVCKAASPLRRLVRRDFGDHIGRFTDSKAAQDTLTQCGWIVMPQPWDQDVHIAYSTTKYETDQEGTVTLK